MSSYGTSGGREELCVCQVWVHSSEKVISRSRSSTIIIHMSLSVLMILLRNTHFIHSSCVTFDSHPLHFHRFLLYSFFMIHMHNPPTFHSCLHCPCHTQYPTTTFTLSRISFTQNFLGDSGGPYWETLCFIHTQCPRRQWWTLLTYPVFHSYQCPRRQWWTLLTYPVFHSYPMFQETVMNAVKVPCVLFIPSVSGDSDEPCWYTLYFIYAQYSRRQWWTLLTYTVFHSYQCPSVQGDSDEPCWHTLCFIYAQCPCWGDSDEPCWYTLCFIHTQCPRRQWWTLLTYQDRLWWAIDMCNSKKITFLELGQTENIYALVTK